MKHIFLALILVLPAGFASADEMYDKCLDGADGTNPAFAKCGGDWVARADTALNAAWNELYGDAEQATKKDLLAEQRLWNAYKEQSCQFLANGEWGREGQVIHFPACRAEVIETRTKQLKYYQSPEN